MKCTVLTISPEPRLSRIEDFRLLNIPLRTLSLSRVNGILKWREVLASIRLDGIDIIHSQGIRADVFSALAGSAIVRIATVHNIPQKDYTMTYGKSLGLLMTHVHVAAWKRLSALAGVSSAVAENVSIMCPHVEVRAISNGVDVSLFRPLMNPRGRQFRQRHNLPVGSRVFMVTGHLSVRKNPILIIKKWLSQFGTDPSNILVFLGDGPLRNECERVAIGAPNIQFWGRQENVHDILPVANVFVSASSAEGLPMAVIEALACGLPVILSDIPPHREIWENDPSVGWLFDPTDGDSLSRVFRALTERDLSKPCSAAVELARGKFGARAMAQGYHALYEKLLVQGSNG